MDETEQRLAAELEDVKAVLAVKQEQLELSARIGKRLLEDNSELSSKLDATVQSLSSQIEVLQQENFRLKSVVSQANVDTGINHELDKEVTILKSDLQSLRQKYEISRKAHEKETKEFEIRIETMTEELEREGLVRSQLEAKLEKQGLDLIEAKAISSKYAGDGTEDNIRESLKSLQENFESAKHQLEVLQNEISKKNLEIEQLQKKSKTLQRQLSISDDEMVGLKKEITEMQEVNRELRDELEQLQPTSNKFMEGNAIFTDVEEQRVALERELITLKIQHSALQTNYENAVKQRQQLRSQVQMMMQMSGNEADAAMLKRTEEAYSQAKAELTRLGVKYIQIQKKEAERTASLRKVDASRGLDAALIEMLQQEITDAIRDKEDLEKQLRTRYMQQVNETNKRRDSEKLLHSAEAKIQALKTENMQLQLRLEELDFQCTTGQKQVEQLRQLIEKSAQQKPVDRKDKKEVPLTSTTSPANATSIISKQNACTATPSRVPLAPSNRDATKDQIIAQSASEGASLTEHKNPPEAKGPAMKSSKPQAKTIQIKKADAQVGECKSQ